MKGKTPLSAAIITKNEAENLPEKMQVFFDEEKRRRMSHEAA